MTAAVDMFAVRGCQGLLIINGTWVPLSNKVRFANLQHLCDWSTTAEATSTWRGGNEHILFAKVEAMITENNDCSVIPHTKFRQHGQH